MTEARFNELLNGPLHHPVLLFHLGRVGAALQYVVEQTGEAGERALERYCADREAADVPPDEGEI